MKIQSERANAITAYIESHSAKVGERPIVISGEKKVLPVFKLPIRLLRYNIDNGRFAVEKLVLEEVLKRGLDYDNPDDVAKIRKMLLSGETEVSEQANALIKDLEKFGQLEPGVITHDGFVINGNRRMAALNFLHRKHSLPKWEYLEVQRLPSDIDTKDIWRVEAGLQLSKDKTEKYGPMNELLKIKEGKEAGLTNEEIAAAMFDWKPKDVEAAIDRLQLIDMFLEEYSKKGGYGFIEAKGLHEYFINLQKGVSNPAKKKGLPRKDWSKRITDAFAPIWAAAKLPEGRKGERITHFDIRDLGKIYEDADASELFLKPLHQVKHPKDLKPEQIRDALKDAQEVLDFKKEKQQPGRLIERAIRALKQIDPKSRFFREERGKDAFGELDKAVKDLRKDIGL